MIIPNYFIDNNSLFTVLLTGCIHGNEPASEFTLKELAKDIIDGCNFSPENAFIYKYNYHIIPRVNNTQFRVDEDFIDINRNFPNGKRAEQLKSILRDNYWLCIDCHETLSGEIKTPGFYLYESGAYIGNKVIDNLRAKGVKINEEMKSQKVDVDTPSAFDEWCHTTFYCPAYTIETHTSDSLDQRVKDQKEAVLEIIKEIE